MKVTIGLALAAGLAVTLVPAVSSAGMSQPASSITTCYKYSDGSG